MRGDVRILGIQIEWESINRDELLQQTSTLKKQVDELRETMPSETAADLDTKGPLGEVRKETANKAEDIAKQLERVREGQVQLEKAPRKLEEALPKLKEALPKLEEGLRKLEEALRKLEVTSIQHETKNEEHRYLARLIGVELLLGGLGFLSGVVLATKGFRLWHLKLQVHQDRIIQMKAKAKDAQHNGDAHPF